MINENVLKTTETVGWALYPLQVDFQGTTAGILLGAGADSRGCLGTSVYVAGAPAVAFRR